MTNMGIVLPEPGYHEALRELTRAYGTLLIIDETHTFSPGRAAARAAWGLEPDLLTIGKAIGGGIPCGALGLSAASPRRMLADADADYEDTGGVGGTLAGNALSLAAMRATLGDVLTDEAFEHTIPLADALRRRASSEAIAAHGRRGTCAARLPRRVPLRAPSRRATGPRRTRPPTPSSSATCTCTRSTAAC